MPLMMKCIDYQAALNSEQSAKFAIKELLPILTIGEIKEASQIVFENFERFKKEKKLKLNTFRHK